MRKVMLAFVICLLAVSGAFVSSQATAQSGQGGGGGGQGGGKQKLAPPPPRPARCPDLALATYAFITEVPGGAPLAADEIALRWDVHNAGTAAYEGPSANAQTLALEFQSPAGPHQLAMTPLPAEAATPATGGVTLAQGQSWRGIMRVTLPPEAARRRLRLRLIYAGGRYVTPNDCDITNNESELVR